ncbi:MULTISPECIES: DMT family transporter [unclassified Mycobacterium]|uniref:DMT family transporter n=1 Tax=unclassified Mycobacterium TaxID=2642494 RepID=UPI0026B5B066|nr:MULTISPECIES: DMT family transporter [unclassified Mycobacterium]MDP7702742.1 DMT family transporter [Mycobacterium sp. TY815]MDP7721234.1 DMT family transporter [Mycobacterium sp. TY814]
MSMVGISAIIALFAALASATGDVIRQRSAHEITDEEVGHLKLFGMSLRDAKWWTGGGCAVLNYSLQAMALAFASVVLVTALQVTALLFALPIYARLARHRITRSQWLWATVLAASLAVVIIVGDPAAGHDRAPLGTWMVVAAVMGPILVSCVVAAKVWHGRPQAAALLALVAGSSLALFAVLTKGVVDVLHHQGLGAAVTTPEFFPWLVVMLCGMIFQQSAFRAGSLTASLPTMTVAKPVVATILGVLVLGETLDTDGIEGVVLAIAAAVVITATVALARGEAANMEADAEEVHRVDGPDKGAPVITAADG